MSWESIPCPTCSNTTLRYDHSGEPLLCNDCRQIALDEECCMENRIRCPKCRYSWDPYESEDYDVLADGDHDARCA